MKYRIKEIIRESKIISFFANFNKNLLSYFHNSKIYKSFLKLNIFFKDVILKNATKSIIIEKVKNIFKDIKLKDIGCFIVLVVLFNTLAMLFLGKEIDIFSKCARVFFFVFGIFLILKKPNNPKTQ